jgi:hypothetical protein
LGSGDVILILMEERVGIWGASKYYGFRVPRMRREMPSSGFCCPFTGIAERRRAAYLYGGDDGELGVELGETVQQSRCRGRLASVQDQSMTTIR